MTEKIYVSHTKKRPAASNRTPTHIRVMLVHLDSLNLIALAAKNIPKALERTFKTTKVI